MGLRRSIFGIFIIPLFLLGQLHAQDQPYARRLIDTLSSPSMHGRGYVSAGDSIAADFIQSEFRRNGVEPYGQGYYQSFNLDVNTFPGAMELAVDNQSLIPGTDFIINPFSAGTYSALHLLWLKDLVAASPGKLKKILSKTDGFNAIIIEEGDHTPGEEMELFVAAKRSFGARAIIILKKKLTWSVSSFASDLVVLEVLKSRIPKGAKKITLSIESKFEEEYNTQNIIAYKDNGHPDSIIVFTAHYDHLGRMGKSTYFPGANDNASGVAMLLDLAQYYQSRKSNYDIAFIAFAGEEAGLIGSKYFTENPFFPMKKIKFLVNLDLMGNGEEGITVVNGSIHEKEFNTLATLNEQYSCVPLVKKRGKAQNSDHYYFTENDVPAFFIYTLGGNKAYHDVRDISGTLELKKYDGVFQLITEFVKTF